MPVYNEEANIETVVNEWVVELKRLAIPFVLLAINDGSKDKTGKVLRRLAAQHSGLIEPVDKENAGHGRACRTGYALAVERGASWMLQVDSDGQCDPAFFAAFWNEREKADAIFGVRKTRDDGFMRVLVSSVCRITTSTLCGIDLRDANVPYRLVGVAKLKDALAKIPAEFDMQNVALTLALKRDVSVRWSYVPIHFRDRRGGTNSINLRKIAAMGLNLLFDLHRIER